MAPRRRRSGQHALLSKKRRTAARRREPDLYARLFECVKCGKMFGSQRALRIHKAKVASTHDIDPHHPMAAKCDSCPKAGVFHSSLLKFHESGSYHMLRIGNNSFEDSGDAVDNSVVDDELSKERLEVKSLEHVASGKIIGNVHISNPSDPGNVDKCIADFLQIYLKDGTSMSQQTANNIIQWVNKHASRIVEQKLPTVQAMINTNTFGSFGSLGILSEAEENQSEDPGVCVLSCMELSGAVPLKYFYRDLPSCINQIINDQVVQECGIVANSSPLYASSGKRLFGPLHSARSYLRYQEQIKEFDKNGVPLFIMLYSDKTSKRSGGPNGMMFYPILMTFGNIPLHVRRRNQSKCLVGLIPIKTPGMTSDYYLGIIHRCFAVIIEQIRGLFNTGMNIVCNVFDSPGTTTTNVTFYPVLGCLLGDHEERGNLAGIYTSHSSGRPCLFCNCTYRTQNINTLAREQSVVVNDPDYEGTWQQVSTCTAKSPAHPPQIFSYYAN